MESDDGNRATNRRPFSLQFWGAEKETQQRLETAIFEDLNRYCWNQQNSANISISTANANSSTNPGPQVISNTDGQVLNHHTIRTFIGVVTSMWPSPRVILIEVNLNFSLMLKLFSNFVKIYTITVLNSSSGDQWLRKDVSTSSDQPNGLDINLDTILSNYPYVKTECFSYDDSGFGTAESTKEDINYQHPPTPQILQPQSSGVTTTSVLLESNLSATSDLISYTDMTNNNNEWNIDRNEIKDWETCEANVRLKRS